MGKVVAIGGVAGSGKDTLALLLEKELRSFGFTTQKISFAEPLKWEVRDFCVKHYGIDPATCSRAEKNFVRPILVEHASLMRALTHNTHYVNILESKIDCFYGETDFIIVPDLRFYESDNDEVPWVKSRGGRVVHVSRWLNSSADSAPPFRSFVTPANATEAANDPTVKEAADYQLYWESLDGESFHKLSHYAEKIIQWMINDDFLPRDAVEKALNAVR